MVARQVLSYSLLLLTGVVLLGLLALCTTLLWLLLLLQRFGLWNDVPIQPSC